MLILVIGLASILTLCGAAAIGFGAALFYTQHQTTAILMQAQTREDAHALELKNARLEERATCEARITIANSTTEQMRADLASLKASNSSLVASVARLTQQGQQRARTGDAIANKVDVLTKKVEDATPAMPKPTTELNRKIQDANRKLR